MTSPLDEFARDIFMADRLHNNDPLSRAKHYTYVIAEELIAAGYRKAPQFTDEDVERAARAAYEAILADDEMTWDELTAANPDYPEIWRTQVRAALAAVGYRRMTQFDAFDLERATEALIRQDGWPVHREDAEQRERYRDQVRTVIRALKEGKEW